MGLLSDPSLTPRRNFGKNLGKHSGKICALFYVAGLVWFMVLALPDFHHGTYLSENALSPGLVYAEIKEDTGRLAQSLEEELKRERSSYKSGIPYAWISAKMKQIGLETYVHNFTLRTPLGGGNEYQGKNVYGILRASGVGSTEGIVFSTSYRAPNSLHPDITTSVAVLLAFADFARKRNYWSKDLVFLVTDQEQLGTEAWLKAYCGARSEDDNRVLDAGFLPARAGALQAALNLEIQDFEFDIINVKIEGLNGQLPNLDLFNLVQRLTVREAISSGYKQNLRKKRRTSKPTFEENLSNMFQMVLSQANGVPSGNHGLFNRYRIESLTLEAIKRRGGATSSSYNSPRNLAISLLKTIEGISRSLNNLLERFHQSFFFYILVQNDRYISIGDYIPALCLLAAAMFIKAFLLWLSESSIDESKEEGEEKQKEEKANENENEDQDEANATKSEAPVNYHNVILCLSIACTFGFISNALYWSVSLRDYIALINLTTAQSVSLFLLITVMLGAAVVPVAIGLTQRDLKMLQIASLILLGDCLIVLGLMNFALGFLVGIFSTPLVILIDMDSKCAVRRLLSKGLIFALNPLVVVYGFVFVLTLFQFPEMQLMDLLWKALYAAMDTITFAVVDNIIYGNWLYSVMTLALFPLWLLNWTLITAKPITSK